MKTLILLSTWCAMLLAGIQHAFAQGIEFLDNEKWENVLERAKQQDKPIFIDGYTEYCAPCKELDKKVFPLPRVGEFFNRNFINVKYDIGTPEGKRIQQLFSDVITGYPSLVLVDKEGRMIHKVGGFREADTLIARMQAAMEGRGLAAFRARFRSGEDDDALMQAYFKALDEGYLRDEVVAVKQTLLERKPVEELLNPRHWRLVGDNVTTPFTPHFDFVVKNYIRIFSQNPGRAHVFEYQLITAIERSTHELVRANEEEGVPRVTNDPERQRRLLDYAKLDIRHAESIRAILEVHALKLAGEWEEVIHRLKAYQAIKAFNSADWYMEESLQYVAWHCKKKSVAREARQLLNALQEDKMAAAR
ncbi:MAG: thioredoxin family protein [Odoribacteraceae bacterium]|jgi:thiol-disulfide isomerase/thioredoxin|nr:thioredoxin family protein [Odoribacteraceae bacterium]